MGSTTPNYALRFPYQGEVVTPTHFKNLADDLDAALLALEAQRTDALKRPAVQVYGAGTPTAIPQGTATVLTLGTSGSSVPWNLSGMWSSAQGDRLTCKKAGIYHVRVTTTGANNVGVTGINAFELRLSFAGSNPKVFFHKQNTEGGTSPGGWQCNAIWPMQVNDYVQALGWWSGTGTSLSPFLVTEARCIALL